MRISYKNLWKLLVDKEMTRTELRIKAGLSTRVLTKLGKKRERKHRSISEDMRCTQLHAERHCRIYIYGELICSK